MHLFRQHQAFLSTGVPVAVACMAVRTGVGELRFPQVTAQVQRDEIHINGSEVRFLSSSCKTRI